MRSPVANHKQMDRFVLEEELSAYKCTETDGIFITTTAYFSWILKQPERLPHLPLDKASEELVADSSDVKICPESGQIMLRYRVGHKFNFHIDRSPSGSLWLDQGEWEALRERQLHDEIHLVFTAPWQDRIREEKKLEFERDLLVEKLGSNIVDQLDELRGVLNQHSFKCMALAYLQQ